MKHNKKAKWIMLTTGVTGAVIISTVILVLMFEGVFLPIEDVPTFQLLIGLFALLFGTIFASFCCFRFIYVSKEGIEDENRVRGKKNN